MQEACVSYKTTLVWYAHGRITFDLAVRNLRTLFEVDKGACAGRTVHFSMTNASSESVSPYFRGKAKVGYIRWASESTTSHSNNP